MSVILNGHSTSVVKNGLESILYYNLTKVQDVGRFLAESAGSGTYTANDGGTSFLNGAYTLPSTGENICVRANAKIESTSAIGVTIVGTDQNDAPMTGQATIGAQVSEGQAYEVVPTVAGKRFKTITSVTISNGVLGDGFQICVLPKAADNVEILYDEGFEANPGKEVKAIYHKFELAHTKRTRGDKTMSISAKYTNNLEGIPKIHNREVSIVQEFHDDGGNSPSETIIIDKCRLSVPRSTPAEDGDVSIKAEGTYGRMFIFS